MPPFPILDGRLEVHQVPAATDNLVWLLRCTDTNEVAAVGWAERKEVLSYCRRKAIDALNS